MRTEDYIEITFEDNRVETVLFNIPDRELIVCHRPILLCATDPEFYLRGGLEVALVFYLFTRWTLKPSGELLLCLLLLLTWQRDVHAWQRHPERWHHDRREGRQGCSRLGNTVRQGGGQQRHSLHRSNR